MKEVRPIKTINEKVQKENLSSNKLHSYAYKSQNSFEFKKCKLSQRNCHS